MVKHKISKFTLIEILVVVAILVILVSIGIVSALKVTKKTAETRAHAEIKMIMAACEAYTTHFRGYPINDTSGNLVDVNFIQHLSKVRVNANSRHFSSDKRPMFIDFKITDMKLSSDNYDSFNVGSVSAIDPFDTVYKISLDKDVFVIKSAGVDQDFDTDDDLVYSRKINRSTIITYRP